MKKFKEFINENLNFNFDANLLRSKIVELKKWLVRSNGLGMMGIINQIFLEQGYTSKIKNEEIAKFKMGIELLKKTNFPEREIALRSVNLEELTLIRDESGEWDYLSKLNTNYEDLADLLVYLIQRGFESENKQGAIKVYNDIISNPEAGLLSIKPYLKNLIIKYFVREGNGIRDFRKFTSNSKRLTQSGERGEEKIKEYLKSKGFQILYSGQNGDFIDMLFGVDMIVYHPDYHLSAEKPYLTVQIKTSFSTLQHFKYYSVDWIASAYPIRFYNLRTEEVINI